MKKFPTIVKTLTSSKALKLTLEIPEDLEWFSGHFDEVKVLPGMVPVLWAEEYLRIYYAPNITIKSVDSVDFIHPITPKSAVELELRVDSTGKIINFVYSDPTYPSPWVYNQGTLRL